MAALEGLWQLLVHSQPVLLIPVATPVHKSAHSMNLGWVDGQIYRNLAPAGSPFSFPSKKACSVMLSTKQAQSLLGYDHLAGTEM